MVESAPESAILLVRHPETHANITGRFVGSGDSPYTAKGERQAFGLLREISGFAPEYVWSSPLRRALATAQEAAALTGIGLREDARLKELDFGEAEALTLMEAQARGIEFDYKRFDMPVAPGGESRAQIQARTAAVMDQITAEGGRHAVLTHGGVFRSALVHLLDLPPDAIWSFHIRNAQLAEVRVVDGHGMLEGFWRVLV